MKTFLSVLFGVFLGGCAITPRIQLPSSLSVYEPTRIIDATHIVSLESLKVPAVHLDVLIDVSRVEKDAPYIARWANYAAVVCRDWYPLLCAELSSDGFKPRDKIALVFLPHHFAPAQYYDGAIFISTDDLCKDLSNYGMIIHELAHAVQNYPPSEDVTWLVEGIADYIRFYRYEADPIQGGIIPGRSKYSDSYRTTACFLAYLVRNYDAEIVKKLNRLLREGDATEQKVKDAIAANPDLSPSKRRTIEALFETFLTDWSQKHGRDASQPNKAPEPTPTTAGFPQGSEVSNTIAGVAHL